MGVVPSPLEARTLASFNDPYIATIYGFEKSSLSTGAGQAGIHALVMELVEGDDLSHRIAQGAMPIADVRPIATQIAEALEAAHEQGSIHRDLKPANIKVRADGTVKVLDFGLAKAIHPAAASSSDAMNSPTITSAAMTQAGVILGTAAYMAPEQARGRTVDRRADIWAFGAVLDEMLTGARAFRGNHAVTPEWFSSPLSRNHIVWPAPTGTSSIAPFDGIWLPAHLPSPEKPKLSPSPSRTTFPLAMSRRELALASRSKRARPSKATSIFESEQFKQREAGPGFGCHRRPTNVRGLVHQPAHYWSAMNELIGSLWGWNYSVSASATISPGHLMRESSHTSRRLECGPPGAPLLLEKDFAGLSHRPQVAVEPGKRFLD